MLAESPRDERPSLSALALELEQPSAAEAFVRYFAPSLPGRRLHRTALVGIGPRGRETPLLVVEPKTGEMP